jgi:hypothetical protein
MKRHFLTTGAINIENRRTWKARVFFEQPQWLSILPECSQKTRVLFSGEPDHAQFGDHDRPAEDRNDREEKENELAGNGGVLKCKEQTAGCNQ